MKHLIVAASALGFASVTTAAEAGVNRAWVSGKGTDSPTCGAVGAPCRSLQYVINTVLNPGGEIDILDPAGYGAISNIPFAISIINDGVGVAGIQALAGAVVTVNAGPNDIIRLKGLTIEGLNQATTGIQFNSGAQLNLVECTLTDFTGAGVSFQPNSPGGNGSLFIHNSFIVHNANSVFVQPLGTTAARTVISHSTIGATNYAVMTDGSQTVTGAGVLTTISDSIIRGVGTFGQVVGEAVVALTTNGQSAARVSVERSTITQVGLNGIRADGPGALVTVAGSALSHINTVAATPNGGVVNSFGNNGIVYVTSLGALTTIPLH